MIPTLDPREYVRYRLAHTKSFYRWPFETSVFRAELAAALGGLDEWIAPDLAVETLETGTFEGFARTTLAFTTRPGLRAVGHLLTPSKPTGAAVLCLPGHGPGADSLVGLVTCDYSGDFPLHCVRRGWTTFVLEQLSFGRRRDGSVRSAGPSASSCRMDANAATMLGESLIGWRAWDAMRALDLLETLPGVDPTRLATLGISGGGLTSLFTAALDERVAACGVSGYFNTWADSILGVDHCTDNVAPGLATMFDMPTLAGLVAPRKLFCESGASDPIFPLAGFDTACAVARAVYGDLRADGNFGAQIFEGGHRFCGERLFPFFETTLGS